MSKIIKMGSNLPTFKKGNSEFRVSDLFKDNAYTMQECNIVKRTPRMLNSFEQTKLENSYKLDKLFNSNRYAKSVSNNNAKSKDVELKYSKSGAYFVDINGNSVFINNISKIEELDYIPASAIVNRNLSYSAYDLYEKHQSGQDVLIARIVFAS